MRDLIQILTPPFKALHKEAFFNEPSSRPGITLSITKDYKVKVLRRSPRHPILDTAGDPRSEDTKNRHIKGAASHAAQRKSPDARTTPLFFLTDHLQLIRRRRIQPTPRKGIKML